MIEGFDAFGHRFVGCLCQGGAEFGEGAGVGEAGGLWVCDEGNAVGAGTGSRFPIIHVRNAQVIQGGGFSFGERNESPGHDAVRKAAVEEDHHVDGAQGPEFPFFFPVQGRGGSAAGGLLHAAGGNGFHQYRTGFYDFMGVKVYLCRREEDCAFLRHGAAVRGASGQPGFHGASGEVFLPFIEGSEFPVHGKPDIPEATAVDGGGKGPVGTVKGNEKVFRGYCKRCSGNRKRNGGTGIGYIHLGHLREIDVRSRSRSREMGP